jgi:hypothetical protein
MNTAEREIVISEQPAVLQTRTPPSLIIGTLVGFDADQYPLVIHVAQAEPQALCAQTIVDLNDAHIGRQVVLQFAINCAERPIIMGMLRDRETLNHRISLHVAKTGFQLSIVW